MAKSKGSQKTYDPGKKFTVGTKLYHKIWDDKGVVTEVGETPDEIAYIIVEFENVGLKKLCVGTDLKLE